MISKSASLSICQVLGRRRHLIFHPITGALQNGDLQLRILNTVLDDQQPEWSVGSLKDLEFGLRVDI